MLSITILLKKMEKMVKIYSNDELTALGEISSKTNSDPFRILISTILSHRTRDVNTSKASKNLFSVIIPTYKRVLEVKKAIDSVILQTINNWEIIVVDNNSKDGTISLIKSYNSKMTHYFEELLNIN